MKPDYRYEHKIVIEMTRPEVLEDYLDYDSYNEWQPTLKRIELKSGSYLQEGHLIHLVYSDQNDNELVMAETIVEYTPPHKIINRYQVGTTVNLQYNYFESFGAKTMWTCVTEFYFEGDPPASLEVFQRSTKRSLLAFKKYAESR